MKEKIEMLLKANKIEVTNKFLEALEEEILKKAKEHLKNENGYIDLQTILVWCCDFLKIEKPNNPQILITQDELELQKQQCLDEYKKTLREKYLKKIEEKKKVKND